MGTGTVLISGGEGPGPQLAVINTLLRPGMARILIARSNGPGDTASQEQGQQPQQARGTGQETILAMPQPRQSLAPAILHIIRDGVLWACHVCVETQEERI